MKKHMMYALIVWAFLFGLLEIGLRVYQYVRDATTTEPTATYNPASIFVPHPFAAYVASPAYSGHNEQGFRAARNVRYDRDSTALRIVSLGGSSTYGTRVSRENSYPYLLEQTLSKSLAREVEVINAGLGGYSTPNIISLLSLRIVHLNPDILLFYVGFNDAWNRLLFSDFKLDYSHAQKSWEMPHYSFLRSSRVVDVLANRLGYRSADRLHLHDVAWRRPSNNVAANLRNSSGDAFRRNLKTLIAIARVHGAVPILITQATNFQQFPLALNNDEWTQVLDEHNKILEQVAGELSVHVIDVRSVMSDRSSYFADALHMNETGNRKRAQLIAQYLIKNELVGE